MIFALSPVLLLFPVLATAADLTLPGMELRFTEAGTGDQEVATAVKLLLGLTVLSLAPGFLIVMTSFTRIIVVLSMLRHAFGMQQTPPNSVLLSLALFLTLFNMLPTLQQVQEQAWQPYNEGRLASAEALREGMQPLRDFMIRQTREQDLALMVEVGRAERPNTVQDIDSVMLIPAFMLSELRTAFEIGFAIFLPFLLIDIVVASILMSMGMLMVPPMMISLPIKVLMFVLIDGWNLVIQSLMSSFA
jgi:flagellar biosynthetic protein FliP